jgi:hypothetical protein
VRFRKVSLVFGFIFSGETSRQQAAHNSVYAVLFFQLYTAGTASGDPFVIAKVLLNTGN